MSIRQRHEVHDTADDAQMEAPSSRKRRNPLEAVSDFFTVVVEKFLPDPLVIAIILTIAVMLSAMIFEGATPFQVLDYWGEGWWSLLEFTMQMTVMLLTGYVLAHAPAIERMLDAIAGRITSPNVALVVATLTVMVTAWINWGFGLVMCGVIAQKLGSRVKGLHYPMALVAGYSGFVIYGTGLSGTIPITIATDGHFLEDMMGTIPTSQTIFSPYMLITTIVLAVTLPVLNIWLHPKDPEKIVDYTRITGREESASPQVSVKDEGTGTLADKLNNSPVLGIAIGVIAFAYLIRYFVNGGQLHLNSVNFLFLFAALILFARPAAFLDAVTKGITVVAGIVVQFPFYAGIMAILTASGLGATLASVFGAFSTAETLPFWSFISGGLINLVAPSGGGQWAIQGPVMIEAAENLGADMAAVAVGVAIGDQWTNMIQPFWLIPVLAISGLKLKHVMGPLTIVMVFQGIIFSATTLIWGFMAVA